MLGSQVPAYTGHRTLTFRGRAASRGDERGQAVKMSTKLTAPQPSGDRDPLGSLIPSG